MRPKNLCEWINQVWSAWQTVKLFLHCCSVSSCGVLCCFWVSLQCAGLKQLLVTLPAAGAAQAVTDMSKGRHIFFVPSLDVLVSHHRNQLVPHKAAIERLAKERPGSQETEIKKSLEKLQKFGHNPTPSPSEVLVSNIRLSAG